MSGFCADFHDYFLEKKQTELKTEWLRTVTVTKKQLDSLKLKLVVYLAHKVNANQKVKFKVQSFRYYNPLSKVATFQELLDKRQDSQ